MAQKWILYRTATGPWFPNSNANCRLIVGFSDTQYTEANPGCSQVQKDVTLTASQMCNDVLCCRTHAIDASNPSGPFLTPAAADSHSTGCGH